MILKDISVILQMILDMRCIRLLIRIHREFKKDKNYRFLNLLKAFWLVGKNEKIIKHQGSYIVSSFLPPIPSRAFEQVIYATPGKNSLYSEHIYAQRTAPISMYIAVTEQCNYRCWHCSSANRNSSSELTLPIIKNTISQLQEMGTAIIGLTGGEPLLRQDITDIVSAIDERSISTLFTTGQGLTLSKAKELKDAGLYSVGISLDHYDEKTFNKLRGNDAAFHTAIKAIEYFLQAGIYTMIQCVATKEMIQNDEVWNMIHFAKRNRVHEIKFLETMPTGMIVNIEKKNILTEENRQELINIHKKANWSGNNPKVTAFAHTESHQIFGCGAGTQHSYIDASGNLYPCDFVPLSFGSVEKMPVKELWQKMNRTIGKPRKICLSLEAQDYILKDYKSTLPIDPGDSIQICTKCQKVESLPGFYTTLGGLR